MTPTLKYPGAKWRTVAERGATRVECLWLNPRAEERRGRKSAAGAPLLEMIGNEEQTAPPSAAGWEEDT